MGTVRPQRRRLRADVVGCFPATAAGSPHGWGEVAVLDVPLALARTDRNFALLRTWSRLGALGTKLCGCPSVPRTDAASRSARPVQRSKVLIRRETIGRWSVRNRTVALDDSIRCQSSYSQIKRSRRTWRCSWLRAHRRSSEYLGRVTGTEPSLERYCACQRSSHFCSVAGRKSMSYHALPGHVGVAINRCA